MHWKKIPSLVVLEKGQIQVYGMRTPISTPSATINIPRSIGTSSDT